MGWKASLLIIQNPGGADAEGLLRDIGFQNLKAEGQSSFDMVMNPDYCTVHTGLYKNNLIICEAELPQTFMQEELSPVEKLLHDRFPDSEICALGLHSVVDYWGYSVSKRGEKIRVRAGSGDDGTFVDYGDILEEEKELFSKATVNEEGDRIFIFEEMPGDEFLEAQVGENFVFAVARRYLGIELDRAGDDLFELMLSTYTLKPEPDSRPWWKFWK